MPEGPSIVILKEEIETLHIIGEQVIGVSGNTSIEKTRMEGQTLTAFKSWGKQSFLCFPTFALRIHFLLWGTYRINERKETPVRLSLRFKNAELNFYSCSLRLIDEDLDGLYDWSADVMSDKWDPEKAFVKLKQHPEMLVCDALLDQQIFSGVGNIIKNEVLFILRIHPLAMVGSLPDEKLMELISEARTYSFDFLRWKKAFELKKHWLVHTKSICPRCDIPLKKGKLGKSNRRSFYCENCQILY